MDLGNGKRPIGVFVMRDLMLEALAYEGTDLGSGEYTFKACGYMGSQYNLFRITEYLAIKLGLVVPDQNIDNSMGAWGVEGRRLYSGANTNFTPEEIETLSEVFWLLLNQHIIAPGAYKDNANLPIFHVTPHGKECLKRKEILPYDINGYLQKMRKIPNLNVWVEHYMHEAVRCFNADCMQAAVMMVGLAGEKLTIELIEAFEHYLTSYKDHIIKARNSPIAEPFDVNFKNEVDNVWQISAKYNCFEKYFNGLAKHHPDIKRLMEPSSRRVFAEYTRLTRNEVSHPNELKRDYTETLLLLISFLKYIEIVTELTEKMKNI